MHRQMPCQCGCLGDVHLQIIALDELHHHVIGIIAFDAEIEHVDDVRVAQLADRRGLRDGNARQIPRPLPAGPTSL